MSVLDQYRALSSAPQVTDDAVRDALEKWNMNQNPQAMFDAMRCVLEQFAASAPAGSGEWVMVPREPTKAMQHAGLRALDESGLAACNCDQNAVYRAMLASAPSAVEDAVEVSLERLDDIALSLSNMGRSSDGNFLISAAVKISDQAEEITRLRALTLAQEKDNG